MTVTGNTGTWMGYTITFNDDGTVTDPSGSDATYEFGADTLYITTDTMLYYFARD